MFDYYDLFIEKGAAKIEDLSETKWDNNFIKNFNDKSLKRSIFLQNDCEDVTSIYINYPALLLRKKSEMFKPGGTSTSPISSSFSYFSLRISKYVIIKNINNRINGL